MSTQGWSVWRITLALFPFGAGAMALNIYFGSLIVSWFGAPVMSPGIAVLLSLPLGYPPTWLFAKHIKRLMTL